MQKMRISITLLVYFSPSGGWVEGESILFTNKNTLRKVVDHLPPFHLREALDESINIGFIRKSVLCWTMLLTLPSATGETASSGTP